MYQQTEKACVSIKRNIIDNFTDTVITFDKTQGCQATFL